jgi:hypothetical protein
MVKTLSPESRLKLPLASTKLVSWIGDPAGPCSAWTTTWVPPLIAWRRAWLRVLWIPDTVDSVRIRRNSFWVAGITMSASAARMTRATRSSGNENPAERR